MTDTTAAKAKPKTRAITFDSLRVHAAKLPLEQKVAMVKELKEQVDATVKQLQEQANNASTMASQLAGANQRTGVV